MSEDETTWSKRRSDITRTADAYLNNKPIPPIAPATTNESETMTEKLNELFERSKDDRAIIVGSEIREIIGHARRMEKERDALAQFKAYVHTRLDGANVPVDPESPHKAEGCRIGGRLDWLFAQRNKSEETNMNENLKIETETMRTVYNALLPLSEEAQLRVIAAAFTLLGERDVAGMLMEHRQRFVLEKLPNEKINRAG